jgi:cystathionine beta-lyase/cystathionine gamma-synthase
VAVVGDNAEIAEKLKFLQNAVGAVLGPFDSFLALRGVKTLALRMQRACDSALAIAKWLSTRKDVARVIYPGLPSHPQHDLAKRQMLGGFGGIISVELKGDVEHRQADAGAHPPVHPGREPGRGRKPDRASGHHDPRLDPGRSARGAGHLRHA